MADIVLREPSQLNSVNGMDWQATVVQVIPNIPMSILCDIALPVDDPSAPNMSFCVFESDIPQFLQPDVLVDKVFSPFNPPYLVVLGVLPSKPYLMVQFYVPAGTYAGVVGMIAAYEIMSGAMYNRLMRAKRVTLKQIEACSSQVDEHEAAKVAAQTKKAELEEESTLWGNFLSEEIALYELLEGGS